MRRQRTITKRIFLLELLIQNTKCKNCIFGFGKKLREDLQCFDNYIYQLHGYNESPQFRSKSSHHVDMWTHNSLDLLIHETSKLQYLFLDTNIVQKHALVNRVEVNDKIKRNKGKNLILFHHFASLIKLCGIQRICYILV